MDIKGKKKINFLFQKKKKKKLIKKKYWKKKKVREKEIKKYKKYII
jgi:hypothetical protein